MQSEFALVTIAIVGTACHTGAPAPRPEPHADTCLGASDYVVSHRTDGARVLIEAHTRSLACNVPSSTAVLVEIPLPAMPSTCPIGEPVLEHVRDRETSAPRQDFVASLDALARAEVTRTFEDFARQSERGARAFVASCAPLRWVFVEVASSKTPRWQGWTYEAADAPPPSTPSNPPVCSAPPLPAGATRWIGRSLTTGAMPGPSTLTTFVLDRTPQGNNGEHVRLVQFTQRAAKERGARPTEVPPPVWTCEEASVSEGTMQRERGRLVLAFDGTEGAQRTCTLRKVRVAPVDALRESLPQIDESCKRSKWQRVGPVREILSCEGDNIEHLIFARGAGVEHVTIDEDDCGDRTAALRSIDRDGAVRIVRRYRR